MKFNNAMHVKLSLVPSFNHVSVRAWKGNVPLGHFYKILVIKCSTQMLWVIFVPKTQEVQIKIKGMFLDLVHCFED
jgi:hypothetical protein